VSFIAWSYVTSVFQDKSVTLDKSHETNNTLIIFYNNNIKANLQWEGHIVWRSETRNIYIIFVEKPLGNRPLRTSGRQWEDTMKTDVKL
jgi:hypothetical protein